MKEQSEQQLSIRQEFQSAVQQLQSNTLPANELLDKFLLYKRVISAEDLYSLNERLEDIGSGDLLFLAIDAHLGECYSQLQCMVDGAFSAEKRLSNLNMAKTHFCAFMDVCEIFGVVELDSNVQQCLKSWKLYNSNKQEWIASVQSRDAKIQRFKLLKELQRKLQDNNIGDCNDMERQKALLGLQIASIQTVENLVMIEQESQLLQMRQSAQTVQKQQPSTDQTDCVDIRPGRSILNATGPLLSREGKPLRPFVITNNRQQMMDNVFKPSHRLPTMSIDDYLKQEYERGNVLKGGTDSEPKPKLGDGEDEEVDENAIYKKREWDNFKDDNPRGWGNRNVNRG